MTQITITFNIPEEEYNSYNSFIDGILNDLEDMGAEDIDVTEKELQK